jgi:hypothetical protein
MEIMAKAIESVLADALRLDDGKGFPVTAREMTDKEKKRYKQWKKR